MTSSGGQDTHRDCDQDESHEANPPRNQKIASSQASSTKTTAHRDKRKAANRARHRLLSIQHDVETYLKPLLRNNSALSLKDLPVIANERAGTWYAWPLVEPSIGSSWCCHFKSTDGHVHLFSLKRLNLSLITTVAQSPRGSVLVVDASNKKEMPDSFSRSIPIWCAVLNRIVERYRTDLNMAPLFQHPEEDLSLHIPTWIIPETEQSTMKDIIATRVEELYKSRAIVDITQLVATLTKPLRPFWITPLHSELPNDSTRSLDDDRYFNIICANASNIRLVTGSTPNNNNSRIVWVEDQQFYYTPGAADDHESWARHLSPQLFWEHVEQFQASLTDQVTDDLIDRIVQQAEPATLEGDNSDSLQQSFDWIGGINLAIGTRRSGRPPDCWNHFDAILNVTNTEYDNVHASCQGGNKFYLQLPVEEGKRDRHELERLMAVGIIFIVLHVTHNRRILVHCAQGKDRSVAVVMAVAQLLCNLHFPLQWDQELLHGTLSEIFDLAETLGPAEEVAKVSEMVQSSGLSQHLVQNMIGREGGQKLIEIIRRKQGLSPNASLATKESLRIALHLIRQDREQAEPTRSTLQKLNRFFMSNAFTPSSD